MTTALGLGLDHLSATERDVFDAMGNGGWMDTRVLAVRIWGDFKPSTRHALAVNISRMRRRLEGTGWRIESAAGRMAYRLVQAA